MKLLCYFALFLTSGLAVAQSDSLVAIASIKEFQDNLNKEYRTPDESPLEPKALKKFKGHDFFPVSLKYRVTATLTRTDNTAFLKMKTTTSRLAEQRKFGILTFSIDGKQYELPVYQSASLMNKPEYKDYLFLPFTDLTNGETSYHAGRYIDLRIPTGDHIVIDFNQAYNPSCAYSDRYSCPIVPKENHLDVEILAGVRFKH